MFRILVAEDDESTRLLMCEVLRQAGYEPCPAKDGVEALIGGAEQIDIRDGSIHHGGDQRHDPHER